MSSSDESAFYEAVADLGGRPSAMYRDSAVGALMDNFASIAGPSLPTHVYWNYIESPEVNAVALYHRDREFIGVNVGTIVVLYDVFLSLLADPSFAPDIGIPSASDVDLSLIPLKILAASSKPINDHDRPFWLFDRPDDPFRRLYAQALSHCALDFILQHELAHLEGGHLEYIQMKSQQARLLERRVQDDDVWGADVSQACEIDADLLAVSIALHRLRRIQSLPDRPEFANTYFAILRQARYSYRVLHTALGMLFFVFGLDDVGFDADVSRSHPHPHLRDLMSYHKGLYSTRKDAPYAASQHQTGHEEAQKDLVHAWIAMGGREFALSYVGSQQGLKLAWRRLLKAGHPVWDELRAASDRRRQRVYGK